MGAFGANRCCRTRGKKGRRPQAAAGMPVSNSVEKTRKRDYHDNDDDARFYGKW